MIQLGSSKLYITELCYTTVTAVGAIGYVWCRNSDTPSVITARDCMFSCWPTQFIKTRFISLHVKSQVELGFSQVKIKLAMLLIFGGPLTCMSICLKTYFASELLQKK